MTITKHGAQNYHIMDIVNGVLVQKKYIGYTKKEATRKYKASSKK